MSLNSFVVDVVVAVDDVVVAAVVVVVAVAADGGFKHVHLVHVLFQLTLL